MYHVPSVGTLDSGIILCQCNKEEECMRRLLSVLLVLALATTVATGCRSTTPTANEIKVGLVTDVGGRGDQSFNDSALRGLEAWLPRRPM